jgi:outer membrane lipoprotein-sorting protein
LSALLLVLSLAWPVAAATPDDLSREDQADLQRIIDYLNGLTTIDSRFVQMSSNGAFAEGQILVDRPRRLRFEYDPPHPILIVANGLELIYYDKELEQATRIPLWETPLWFLIGKNIVLNDGVVVLGLERSPGSLSVLLAQSETAEEGTVMLTFSDHPLVLQRWQVTDPRGTVVDVALVGSAFGGPIDDEVFDITDLPGVRAQPRSNR